MRQYRNTVIDLVAWVTSDDAPALDAVTSALDELPEDRREPTPEDIHGSYRRLDQTLQQQHVDVLYAAGVAVAAELTAPSRLSTTVGQCATDSDDGNDQRCLDDFVRRFGQRALRRPLRDDELAFYIDVYGDDPTPDAAAYADVITVLLNAPDFVYFVEHGDEPVTGQDGVFEVSATELASRLSYQLWQTAPDERLLQTALDGDLADSGNFEAQIERLLDDPRARVALDEFAADWLKVEDLPPLDQNRNDPLFEAFAGDTSPDRRLRDAMIDDVLSMVSFYTWDEPSGISELLQSNRSFARDDQLANLYGVAQWDGTSQPPTFGNGERPGLFTRALFLTTGSANTRPIRKGVFLRQQVLCDVIPPPPAGANANVPDLRPDMTTREVVEELTEAPGTACAGCHSTLINPLGFATENFDALGRLRSEQALFDDEGSKLGSKAVDTSSVPQVILGDTTETQGAEDLMRLIANSGKAEACLARNYFRFTFARWEDAKRDGCTLEAMRETLAAGGSLRELLKATVLDPAFRRRAFE